MESLQVDGLRKTFGSAEAVSELSFSLHAGQLGVLVGPSGAGKTTTLSMIAGIVTPDEGQVLIGGTSMAGVPPERRDVAMVFENYALYPHMSVRANLEFPLLAPVRAKELGRDATRQRVLEVAEVLRIGHLLDRLPSQLSGGQRQRVSLGRALVRRPKVLLLDEPITHLDAKLRHEMRTELKRIQRELGTTTLYATPDQADALALGDLVVVLDHGRVWQIDHPGEVYRAPAHVRVAEMVGSPRMNLLTGEISRGHVHVLGRRLVAGARAAGVPDGTVAVGIRPTDLELTDGPAGDTIQGTVTLRQSLGYAEVLYVSVDAVELRVVTPPGSGRDVGQAAAVRFDPANLHLFDAHTGWALSAPGQRP